ncbi:MAG: glycosyltransferase N-terminal domain-containing protein [Hydrogenophaga sp.]|uniref:3-deoxy-D-manno-octulosonic acid transferase n=1 Tax=Hydrogenophaga sp. TaxID=1904254 RepID=UPI002766B800|nr:glycosyltransferase N-terminal domain-containing protein [Hydrogenophaga sp.]MDP2417977.1 glycosyltransferase N-terminal domain-containing protein [Hydrogenophaga sp.]MDZ4187168.1 glycosyltransferase N-terminal domain-containing protein [Hydrogenophaga sp.]
MKTHRPLALRAYLLLAHALAPVWRWGLQRRLQRGKETEASIQQKLGLQQATRPAGPLVWGHAVGVGESMALAGLFARLAPLRPELNFLITTTARTSGDALRRNGLPPRCQHQFAPVDTPDATARFLDHWQPTLAVWCEMDLWPALMAGTDARGMARVLVNARLSAASLAKRRWGRWVYQALMPGFRHIFAQNVETVDALASLGAVRARMSVTGTIKSLSPALACNADTLHTWEQALGQRPLWLLASSHPGEEALALQAHARLRQHWPEALLIIAPRVPTRGAEVQALCNAASATNPGADTGPNRGPVSGPNTSLRSANAPLPTAAGVYVADTVGEMGLWYRLAPVALVGGSIAQVGGHNPYEPLALGCAVLHGPNVWNFAEAYQTLDALGLSEPVTDAQQIAQAVASAWASPATRQDRRPTDAQVDTMLLHLQALLD